MVARIDATQRRKQRLPRPKLQRMAATLAMASRLAVTVSILVRILIVEVLVMVTGPTLSLLLLQAVVDGKTLSPPRHLQSRANGKY